MEALTQKNKLLIVSGQFLLVFGILGFMVNTLVLGNNYYVAFITGIFLGLALVLNLTYLFKLKKQ